LSRILAWILPNGAELPTIKRPWCLGHGSWLHILPALPAGQGKCPGWWGAAAGLEREGIDYLPPATHCLVNQARVVPATNQVLPPLCRCPLGVGEPVITAPVVQTGRGDGPGRGAAMHADSWGRRVRGMQSPSLLMASMPCIPVAGYVSDLSTVQGAQSHRPQPGARRSWRPPAKAADPSPVGMRVRSP